MCSKPCYGLRSSGRAGEFSVCVCPSRSLANYINGVWHWHRTKYQAGVCEAALRLTASYTSERRQFDKPIAEFQAVGQRAADAYVDTECIRLTAHKAACRLANGWPADEEVATAKFWAGDGGSPRYLNTGSWLYEPLLVDRSSPPHPYWPGLALLIEPGHDPRVIGLLDGLSAPDLTDRR